MNDFIQIWEGWCDAFVAEWPYSLMWAVAVPVGLVLAWRMYKNERLR